MAKTDLLPKIRLNKSGHFVIGNWDDETYRDISPRLSMQKKYKDEIIRRCEENRKLRELLITELDVGRADVDDIGVEAWIEQALKEKL